MGICEFDFKEKFTPFHFLCFLKNKRKVLERVLELGARGSLSTAAGYSPLMLYLDDGSLLGENFQVKKWSLFLMISLKGAMKYEMS